MFGSISGFFEHLKCGKLNYLLTLKTQSWFLDDQFTFLLGRKNTFVALKYQPNFFCVGFQCMKAMSLLSPRKLHVLVNLQNMPKIFFLLPTSIQMNSESYGVFVSRAKGAERPDTQPAVFASG